MKIGMVSDSLGHLGFEDMLDVTAELGVRGIEVNTGNWSGAPHMSLAKLLADAGARTQFRAAFARRGLELIGLNANGNQLHPTDGARQLGGVRDTIRLAGELGVEKVCLMSGLPVGGPGRAAELGGLFMAAGNPEYSAVAVAERLLPCWVELAALAEASGVAKLCVELHGNQLVYNVPTLLRLRREIGPVVGANLEPSHLLWMGADPLAAIDALGDTILHVHAKDTFLNAPKQATTSLLENGSLTDIPARAWSYITLGYGHDEAWWKAFCYRLCMVGYDGWLSIEHEDVLLSRREGVRRWVALLQAVAPVELSDFTVQPV